MFGKTSCTLDLAEGFLLVSPLTAPLFSLAPVEAGLDQVPFSLQSLGNQPARGRDIRKVKCSVCPRTAIQKVSSVIRSGVEERTPYSVPRGSLREQDACSLFLLGGGVTPIS